MKNLILILLIGFGIAIISIGVAIVAGNIGYGDDVNILSGKNYGKGSWLLVNDNGITGEIKIIDDKELLERNQNDVYITWKENHGFTTCDGTLLLFKDGELIESCNYLDKNHLSESDEIKSAYKTAIKSWIYPKDESDDYKRIWDSLLNEKAYPTHYHTQPEDKDIIRCYSLN